MFQDGDSLPHFTLTTLGGGTFSYASIWQRHHLVLVVLPGAAAPDAYVRDLEGRREEFAAADAVCAITADRVEGLEQGGVVIADRWGEIIHVVDGSTTTPLPAAADLVEWARYVQRRCPECEGETK